MFLVAREALGYPPVAMTFNACSLSDLLPDKLKGSSGIGAVRVYQRFARLANIELHEA